MNKFGNIATNEHLQLFLMIPVFLGALYVAVRIAGAGVDIRSMLRFRPRLIACIAFTLAGVGCFAYMFLSHLERQIKDAPANRVLVWITGVYVAFFMYFLLVLTISDILGLILRAAGHGGLPSRFFMMLSAGIAALLTFYGVMHARNVRTVFCDLSSGGKLSEPVRIVEVSDLHMGSVIGTAHVRRVVDAVNAQHPDIVVFLGDQFNRTSAVDVVDAEEMFRELSHIEAPLGVYAVLGNHDPELSEEIYQQYLTEGGITSLDNGVLEIIPGKEGQKAENRTLVSASSDGSASVAAPETPADGSLLVAGRTKLAEDAERVPLGELLGAAGVMPGSGGSVGSGSNVVSGNDVVSGSAGGAGSEGASGGSGSNGGADASLSGTVSAGPGQPEYYLLVLDHDPNGITEAVSCDADLVLAGHTHRGQFFPTTLITQFSYEKGYFYGLAQTSNESTGHITTSFVSSGAGYFQTPIRIGTDTEIVCIEIK